MEHVIALNPAVIFIEKPLPDRSDVTSTFVSESVVSLLGYQAENFLGHSGTKFWADHVHPDDLRKYRAEMSNLWRDGQHTFEFRFMHNDGKYRWLREEQKITRDPEGNVKDIVGYMSDISEMVERTAKLHESEERYRSVVENIPYVVWIHRNNKTVYMSHNVSKILGYPPEDIVTEDNRWKINIHPDDSKKVDATLDSLFTRNIPYDIEYRVQRKDEEWIWLHERAVSIIEMDGARYTYGLFSDITERKKLEEELRSAREQLEYAVFSNPAVIYVGKPLTDRSDFWATYISKSVGSVLGFEAEQLTGESGAKFWESRVPVEDLRKFRAEVALLWRDGQHTFEYRFLHKDGRYRWIREEQRVVRDAEGNVRDVVGYWIDITEQKRLEEELLRSQRLAAIGETAAMVGHDLRNPLQGITGATYALRKQLEPSMNWKVEEMLDLISNAVNYSNRIITDLLDYSRELTLDLHETALGQLTKQAISLIEVPENVKIVDFTSDEPKLIIDPAMVQRIFVNIIKNSIDAMPDGGQITISDRIVDDRVELKFKDTGRGFTQESLKEIWKPFKTSKARGLGLGLAISKRIVEAHQGSVSVESDLGKGTTIIFTFPTGSKE